jgi:hypothetical protein
MPFRQLRSRFMQINAISRFRRSGLLLLGAGVAFAAWTLAGAAGADPAAPRYQAGDYATFVKPLMTRYCLTCHSSQKKKGDLDLERFTAIELVRKDLKPWQAVVEMLDNGEMPPKKSPQPPANDKRRLLAWVRGLLDAEARARAGDPGRVVLRRLSNAEYNNTIHDLTGVDLQPARDFPVDGAAGEGFTNAGDALVTSPTLLNKYLNAAKEIAAHAVLLPDGFRFSPSKTRRDWTDEILAELRAFYEQFATDGLPRLPIKVSYSGSEFYSQRFWDGQMPLKPYLAATIRHREDLAKGKVSLEAVAAPERLNVKYLRMLYQTLADKTSSFPLDAIRAQWQRAKSADVDALAAEIGRWQKALWRFVPIGSYRYGNNIRQLPNNPVMREAQTLKLQLKPVPGQSDVVVYLAAREFPAARQGSSIVWYRPRFEGGGKPPLLLRDYAQYGDQLEVDYRSIFAGTARYLAAAAEAAKDPKRPMEDLARSHGLNAAWLQRWIDLLALTPGGQEAADTWRPVQRIPVMPLQLLDWKNSNKGPAIHSWTPRGEELPVLITNSSDKEEHVPGRLSPHQVAVHPTPTQFVAVAWKSPIAGWVRVGAKIVHAHPACGNGIAWWLEHRTADQAAVLDARTLNIGRTSDAGPKELQVGKGDLVILAVDPRDGNHACDLTEIGLTITETAKPGRVWDLARDVADTVLQGNPHADRHGSGDTWRFVRGPVGKWVTFKGSGVRIAPESVLARWRTAAADTKRQTDLGPLADQVRAVLAGERPAQETHPDRVLYDTLVSLDGPLLQGMDLAGLHRDHPGAAVRYGLDRDRFSRHPAGQAVDEASLVVPATSVLATRLPAALFREREFVVEARLDAGGPDRVVQCQVLTTPPQPDAPLDVGSAWLAPANSATSKHLLQGLDEFRRYFPSFICYGRVIPDDETVCLKLFHREDEPLIRLFLDDAQTKQLDRLWSQLRFISQWPVVEHKQLPLFIGFVTQDQPKELLAYFESQREPFHQRALAFEKDSADAIPEQLKALEEFAARAYRRPVDPKEKADLTQLYAVLRQKAMSHDEAFRAVLTRLLIAPSFLFKIEKPGDGIEARPVSDWELATRLSYFLWATMPDAELRQAAAAGRLHDPQVLTAQVNRMLRDAKVRGLAVEFATQWLHVRDVRQNREKNEKLFPTFGDPLREALFEESVLFCQDLFRNDRPFDNILDADYTFLNETLARHYGIPDVTGPQWRRVDGVRKYGRGGVLTLGSVLTQQSGASRTSPVLRGNWLVETMWGEKLPKPPPNVPRLPEEEATSEATVRQLVEKHARIAECAVCHRRIDPFGFALEQYDPIGRFRAKDLAGRPIDTQAQLMDGTHLDGPDGLRRYLLTQRRDDFLRHFSKKLLGYALGRSVTLSDQPLLDEMRDALAKNGNRLSSAVLTIALSKQFRYHRALEATRDD